MNVIEHQYHGGFFIFITVGDDLHIAPHSWEHADLAEQIPEMRGHHIYGMGAGVGGNNFLSFYGYSDGITGEWPKELPKKIADALVESGYLQPNPELRPTWRHYSKISSVKNWNQLQYQRWQNQTYPNEQHGLPGDCINPKCDYTFTPEDIREIEDYSGWFTCPNCGWTFNYLDDAEERKTRAGLTLDSMGAIGESIIENMGEVPGVGHVTQVFNLKTNPIDAIIGPYGVEIKTNHSEAQARFKIGGEYVWVAELGKAVKPRESKEYYCQQYGLKPALIGVRLNFYTDRADIFFREGMTDTWIGNKLLTHVATVDFADLNPFKHPEDVPPASELPDDDSTPPDDIPF